MEHSNIEHMAQGYPPAHIAKDSEEVIVWLATQLLATQEQRDALAAENSSLKVACLSLAGECAQTAGEADITMQSIKTPATDAYLNSVRAEGVEMLADRMQQTIDKAKLNSDEIGALAGAIFTGAAIAAQLRAGEPS